jgi:peptidoglycan hydrolase-like protein with peptidoglycan-binding domain
MRGRLLTAAAIVAGAAAALAGAAAATAALWPAPGLSGSRSALAHVAVPPLAGRLARVRVATASGAAVDVRLRAGDVWPAERLAQGTELTVQVTARRPGWAAWLVGRTVRRTFTITTPAVRVERSVLRLAAGAPVTVPLDTGAELVSVDGTLRRRSAPAASAATGLVATGLARAGSVEVAAAPRTWERLGAPVRVSWFPRGARLGVVAAPAVGTTLEPDQTLTLSFSSPVAKAFAGRGPRISPGAGRWRVVNGHTLSFEPSGLGFPLGSTVRVVLPRSLDATLASTGRPARTLRWQVAGGSVLRVQQVLAQLGYLPLTWAPADAGPAATPSAQLAAALSPPAGTFTWRFKDTPAELRALWQPGREGAVTRGALMRFEDAHGLRADGVPGPQVWRQLFDDVLADKRAAGGYSYVFVHESIPQSLSLWHNGRIVVKSPGNTGIAQAPTQTGTYPVFEHIPVGTMRGTNPDGTHYDDPGVRWISYFHGGDAIHAFDRASYGTPQSLGCVELPLSAAAQVWPFTPVGTLVTIEQ